MGGAEREQFEERCYVWCPQLVKLYDEAKTYIDGKWLTIAISSADDLHKVTKLLTISARQMSRRHHAAVRHQGLRGRRRADSQLRERSKRPSTSAIYLEPTITGGDYSHESIVVMDQAAGTAGMKLVERPEPHAAINDVVVQVHAGGFVNTELEWPSTWADRAFR